MDRLASILDGWKNLVWTSDDVKLEANRRAGICSCCDKFKYVTIYGIKFYPHCSECGCYIPAKIMSKKRSKCKLNKW